MDKKVSSKRMKSKQINKTYEKVLKLFTKEMENKAMMRHGWIPTRWLH